MNRQLITLAVLTALSHCVIAEEQKPSYKANAGLGFSLTSGNTDTTSLSANAHLSHYLQNWHMNYKFDAIKHKNDGVTAADNKHFMAKANYQLTDKHSFLFIEGKRDDDKFGPYAHNNTLAFGYGRQLYQSDKLTINADIGPGYTDFEYNLSGLTDHSAIVHIAGNLKWLISQSPDFTQHLVIDKQLSNGKNTQSVLKSTLSARLNGSLKMALILKLLNNSKVKPGQKNTDTVTSVNLVYQF